MTDSPVTPVTDIQIANNALGMIGGGVLFAFDEDTELAGKVNAVYVDVVETCLSAYGWSFAKATTALEADGSAPLNGYANVFALPANRIGLPIAVLTSFKRRTPLRDFTIEGRNLYADVTPLWATCRVRPEVALWPAPFRMFATKAIAAELAVPVSHDSTLASDLSLQAWGSAQEGKRGGLFLMAMRQDLAQPGPQAAWDEDPLTTAHRAGGGNWWGG